VTTDTILAVLGVGGLSTIAAAIISALMSKRKLGAEATNLITQAASGVVDRIEKELERSIKQREGIEKELKRSIEQREALQAQVIDLETTIERKAEEWDAELRAKEIVWQRVEADWREVLQVHAAWDYAALVALERHDIDHGLETPPPLYPPPGHQHRDQ